MITHEVDDDEVRRMRRVILGLQRGAKRREQCAQAQVEPGDREREVLRPPAELVSESMVAQAYREGAGEEAPEEGMAERVTMDYYVAAIVSIGFVFVAVQLWSIDHQLGRIAELLRNRPL